MGYVLAFAPCVGCGQTFGFNPHRVPSLLHNGQREPVCRVCVARANPQRRANGLPEIIPAPDAYEPCDEYELPDD